MKSPRELGAIAGEAALRKAERDTDFDRDDAALAILDALGLDQKSGEELTDAVKRMGIVPHDDRSFGPVFAMLKRAGKIASVGTTERRKGHGTSGARIWTRRW